MNKNTLAAIIVGLSLFLLFVLILPQYDEIKAAKDAKESRLVLLGERTAAFENVQESNRQVQSRKSDLDKIGTFLPETKQIDEVVSSIQKIAQDAGLQLSGITTSATPALGGSEYKKLLIGLDLVGSYPAFVSFLRLIEQNLRLYDVFEIVATESTTVPGVVNLSIKIDAYHLK